jgi:aspartate kinase
MDYKVLKFGGSILKDTEDFMRVADIVAGELSKGNLPIPVVSAVKGVTDRIVEAVKGVRDGSGIDPGLCVKNLFKEHIDALPDPDSPPPPLMEEFENLEHVLGYVKTSGELNDSAYAFAISRGERFSSLILSEHLSAKGVQNQCFAGEDLLVTDENYRDALVDLEKTGEKMLHELEECLGGSMVPVIAGFSGRSESGRVSILGRGGTDDTAVCVAYCLGANEVIKYVDQKGIMTIDPKFIEEVGELPRVNGSFGTLPDPQVVPYLTYVEASEMMREERIKVVHYKVLNPLIMGDIRFHIRDILHPENPGTVIGPESGNHDEAWYGRPKAITFQRKLSGLRFLPTQSRTPTEVYAKVFGALAEVKVDVRYISISGFQISLLMPGDDLDKAIKALDSLDVALDLSPLDGSKGTFSIVGSGMKGVKGLLSRVTGTIGSHGVNIEQATQPYGENIIRFSVDDEDIPVAVSALYSEFFNGGRIE